MKTKRKKNDENKCKKCNKCNKRETAGESLFSKAATIIEIVILLISIGVSWCAIETSNKIVQYQIEQERLPNVVCLDQEIILDYEVDKILNEIEDYSAINNVNLRIYNLGVGTAQNCEISWNLESIRNVCSNAKQELIDRGIGRECEGHLDDSLLWYQYAFEMDDNMLNSIWYYDSKLQDTLESVIESSALTLPYILPVTDEETELCIQVPDSVMLMLLELGHQEIDEPMSLELNIKYKDSAGSPYSAIYNVKFELKEKGKDDANYCKYDVSIDKKE